MEEKEFDETLDQTEDQTFYRDSFGEKITREGEDEPMPADSDTDMVADEADEDDEDMEPATESDTDDGFHETLDDPGSDFEDKPTTEDNQP